jgi:predicted dehydrogenase
MKVALIGAGAASRPHILSLQDLGSEVDFAWITSRSESRLAAVSVPPSTRKTTRLEDVLEDPQVRAVFVLTPPDSHLEIVRAATRAGKHILLEKPLDVRLDRAEELVALCENHNIKLAVMLQHRLREASQALKGLVTSGALGSLVSVSASVRWWRPQSYYDEPGRGTLARDGGGVLMTQAIHTLDLLLSLTGMPDRVTGLARTSAVHRMETEDTASALLQFPGGALGVLHATTAAQPGFPERIEWNGTLGTATLEAGALRADLADSSHIEAGLRQATGSGANMMDFDHAAHRTVIADFLAAIRDGREPAITGRSALAAHYVIQAIMKSSATGRAVAPLAR